MADDYDEERLKIFDALLSQPSLESLLNTASEVFGNPIFLADRSFHVIARSGKKSEPETIWPVEFNFDNEDIFNDAMRAGDFKRVYTDDEPVIAKYPNFADRMMAARVRSRQSVIGHVVTIEHFRSFGAHDPELLKVICQTLSIALLTQEDPGMHAEGYQTLILDLLDGKVSHEDLDVRLHRGRFLFPETMRLLVMRPCADTFAISPHYLREQLLDGFPSSICVIRNGELVLVVADPGGRRETEDEVLASVYPCGILVGVSRPFCDPSRLSAQYLQADRAIALSESGEDGGIFFYEDVLALHLMESAECVCDPDVFRDSHYERLMAYDYEHGTTRSEDLAVFLRCGRNVNRAAQQLSIHRNSMYYRLEKAAKVAGLDLGDDQACFLLQLAFAMHDGGVELR